MPSHSTNEKKKKKKAKATTEIEVRLDSEMEWNPNRLELLRNYYGSSIQLVSMPRIISVISVIYIYIFGLKTLEIFFPKYKQCSVQFSCSVMSDSATP